MVVYQAGGASASADSTTSHGQRNGVCPHDLLCDQTLILFLDPLIQNQILESYTLLGTKNPGVGSLNVATIKKKKN